MSTVRRKLGDVVNEIVATTRAMAESPEKRAIGAQLNAIAERVREIAIRLLGPNLARQVGARA
jgi:hypothetical protein